MNESQVDELICKFLDRSATADDIEQLEVLLATSSAAAARMSEIARFDTLLATRFGDARHRDEIHQLLIKFDRSHATARPSAPTTISLPLNRRSWRNSAAAWSALVALVFYGTFTILAWNLRGEKWLSGSESNDQVVANVSDTGTAKWSEGTLSKAVSASVKSGESLAIDSGLVELKLKQGAALFVEGPARWSVDGDNRATLKQGKLVAKVPREAIGFTLETPTAQIVDLGTEFGVEVGTDGATGVQVLQGSVDLAPTTMPGSGDKKRVSRQLRAGEAVRVEAVSGSIVAAEFKPEKFGRQADRATKQPRKWSQTLLVDLKKLATASQSSDLAGGKYPASAAIDDDPKTFSHTDVADANAWWQLDLVRTRSIAVVVLHNRTNCCGGWLRDITVKILAEDGKTILFSSPILNPQNSAGRGERNFDVGPAQIVCDLMQVHGQEVEGRYVRVERAPCAVTENDIRSGNTSEATVASGNVISLGDVQVFETAIRSPVEKSAP